MPRAVVCGPGRLRGLTCPAGGGDDGRDAGRKGHRGLDFPGPCVALVAHTYGDKAPLTPQQRTQRIYGRDQPGLAGLGPDRLPGTRPHPLSTPGPRGLSGAGTCPRGSAGPGCRGVFAVGSPRLSCRCLRSIADRRRLRRPSRPRSRRFGARLPWPVRPGFASCRPLGPLGALRPLGNGDRLRDVLPGGVPPLSQDTGRRHGRRGGALPGRGTTALRRCLHRPCPAIAGRPALRRSVLPSGCFAGSVARVIVASACDRLLRPAADGRPTADVLSTTGALSATDIRTVTRTAASGSAGRRIPAVTRGTGRRAG
ncbi:hypothetical protein GCM10010116_61530 [Microbispora rosea subsp. aerata]|nr:hypothetical protein GCM10010116_61530 [Microbispora rosea subsp. aerata]